MPVLFLGHGSPMNAIRNNRWHQSWVGLGQQFGAGKRWPKPQMILCISAHWLTQGWYLTGMMRPPTIHDFSGFPQELQTLQYPAPGAPITAQALAAQLQQPHLTGRAALKVDGSEWGLDHGTWSVLRPMFPAADVPIVQLSMDYSRPPAEHVQLGRQLQALRAMGVLIVGSGNVVHNLRMTDDSTGFASPYDWAQEFDARSAALLSRGDVDALAAFQSWGAVSRHAHPTHDHMLPLLYAAAVAQKQDKVQFFNEGFESASISMRSVIWG
ncbi:4,5-DOPA dioxygenase extradiol [Curvibacter sp. CHRR-16]|uniref:4,5-DOPA-extradiol-dioxygenase n=1 Tax=Curvibacter sp. CHRR-16 TaxID=2835872 RepID=UPI002023B56F|nr:4,5-DOPA dioxygenase extradiol [Curvibacter sp. CHRR-16]